MSMPMVGSWVVVVNAVRPFAIHGDGYLELHVTNEADGSQHLVRVPGHATAGPVAAGDRVTLTFLMGQVTEVRPA
ncbi:MAG: hypothetical protein JWO31_2281 [Phycisphaerales bacterium]|nr:hypothetical protein [Phycisphaerales bacterium]